MRPLRKQLEQPSTPAPTLTVVPAGAELFACPNQPGNLRLSKNACSGLFSRSQKANLEMDPFLAVCRECSTGSTNSGCQSRPPDPVTCVRCGLRTMRRIGGLYCVSCYNRGREFITGKNARGAKPIKYAAPHIFIYIGGLIVVGRDKNEAAQVCTRMTGGFVPSALIDRGLASPAEVRKWWVGTVKPWSAKRVRGSRVEFKL